MQLDMNIDKKLVTVYNKYDGEVIEEINKDIWRVKYIGKGGKTETRTFFTVDVKLK